LEEIIPKVILSTRYIICQCLDRSKEKYKLFNKMNVDKVYLRSKPAAECNGWWTPLWRSELCYLLQLYLQ